MRGRDARWEYFRKEWKRRGSQLARRSIHIETVLVTLQCASVPPSATEAVLHVQSPRSGSCERPGSRSHTFPVTTWASRRSVRASLCFLLLLDPPCAPGRRRRRWRTRPVHW